jgi:uncharacterized membrane protein (UPF0127 family)
MVLEGGKMVVVIGDNQWECSLASTPTELTQGLSGVDSLPVSQGMLFNMGVDYSRIDINMNEMLFPLDIVFVSSSLVVVGVLHDVNPGDEAYFLASETLGARYFLEVNAGEAASVNVGDIVTMEVPPSGIDMSSVIAFSLLIVVVAAMAKLTMNAFSSPQKTKGNPYEPGYYWQITDQNSGIVNSSQSPAKSKGDAIRDALYTWIHIMKKPYPSAEAGQKAILIEVFDRPPYVEGAKIVARAKATAETGVMSAR